MLLDTINKEKVEYSSEQIIVHRI